MSVPVSGANWKLNGISDPTVTKAGFVFLSQSGDNKGYDISAVALQVTDPTASNIAIFSIEIQYRGNDPYVPALKYTFVNCTFRQESGGSGP
jgi:hypothetical protein